MFQDDMRGGPVVRSEFFFPSSWAGERIHALKWAPDPAFAGEPRGVVQIVHGMEEHIDRYDDFARFLALRGFVVCGASHIGHGLSAASSDKLGCLPENGAQVMVADVHTLRTMVQAEYPGLPFFMLGHSMGSFVLRVYLARYGSGLSGAVVCATGQQPLVAARLGGLLSRRIGRSKGFHYKSRLLEKLVTGPFNKGIENARTPYDWISCDPSVVDAYVADPFCGTMFSSGGYASLTDLAAEAALDSCAAAVPEGLPVLFIAGAQDPVGDCGRGVQAAAEAMQRCSGARVAMTLYEGMRHEILNEPGRMEVYFDVLEFFQEIVQEGGR